MHSLFKVAGMFINLNALRFVEYDLVPNPTVIVYWANGDKSTFTGEDAEELFQILEEESTPYIPAT